MTAEQALNRGFNLMLTVLLLLSGLAFASGGLQENDLTDKLDDLGLFAMGIVLLVWYLLGENRFKRSLFPVIVIVLILPVQVYGLLNEISDKEAVGNDIGGMFLYVPFILFTLYQYIRPPRIAASTPSA
jgi:hypothetical protein